MGIQINDSQKNHLDPKISPLPETNPAHWLKVFVIGASGSGKTSLVQTLIEDSPILADKSNESLKKFTWKPGNSIKTNETNAKVTSPVINGSDSSSEDVIPWPDLRVDFWDFCGKTVFRPIQTTGVSSGGFFIVVFNLLDDSSPVNVTLWVRTMQIKVPGSVFVLVGTHSDKVISEKRKKSKINKVLDELDKDNLKEIDQLKFLLSSLKSDSKQKRTSVKFARIEQRLLKRPKIHENVFSVSCVNSEGVSQFRDELIRLSMDTELFPVLNQPKKFLLYLPVIEHLKNAGHVVLLRTEFSQAIFKNTQDKQEKHLDDILSFFDKTGIIMDLQSCGHVKTNCRPIVCINPIALVHCACATHIDTASKAFHFEASRFWPKGGSEKKPDPEILVRYLEEIPAKSLIQEMLLPLLWQDYVMSNNQLTLLLEELIVLGLLVRGDWLTSEDKLFLPNYPSLSKDKKLCAIQLQRLPNTLPCLNWTSKPFAGDAQLSLRYEFPGEAPDGSCLRLVGFCGSIAEQWHSYSYWWRDGLLLRVGECWLCISYSLERYIELTCRINAEEVEESAGSVLWLHLAPFMFSIEDFLDHYMPGLVFKVMLQPVGTIFGPQNREESAWLTIQNIVAAASTGSSIVKHTSNDKEIEFSLEKLFPFKDISIQDSGYIGKILGERCLAKFDKLIASKKLAETVLVASIPSRTLTMKKPKSGQRVEVKWMLDDKPSKTVNSTETSKAGETGTPSSDISTFGQPNVVKGGVVVDQAEELERMERIVFSFIASIMAQATAEIVSTEVDDQHKLTNRDPLVAAAQREMASITAKAITAAQLGDHVGACRAVVTAANAVHRTIKRRDQYNEAPKSKLCVLM